LELHFVFMELGRTVAHPVEAEFRICNRNARTASTKNGVQYVEELLYVEKNALEQECSRHTADHVEGLLFAEMSVRMQAKARFYA
jgi:hypothetical protein